MSDPGEGEMAKRKRRGKGVPKPGGSKDGRMKGRGSKPGPKRGSRNKR